MDRTVRKRARKLYMLFFPKLLPAALLFFIPSLLQTAVILLFPAAGPWSAWIVAGLTILLFPLCSMGAMAYGFAVFQSGQTPLLSSLFRFAENKNTIAKGIVLGAAVTAPSLFDSFRPFFSEEVYSYVQIASIPLMIVSMWLVLRLFLAPYLFFRDPSLGVRECLSGSFRQMKGFCPNLFGFEIILMLPPLLVMLFAPLAAFFIDRQFLTTGMGRVILPLAGRLIYLLYTPYVLLAEGGYACTVLPEERKRKKQHTTPAK